MKSIVSRLSAILALAVLVNSCDDPAAPLPSGVVSVTVDSSAGPLIRVANITLERAAALEVTYGAPGTPILRLTVDSATASYKVVLPRLHASKEYRLQVGIPSEAGVHESKFGTAALPPELAKIKLEVKGTPTQPVSLIEIAGAPTGEFVGLLVIEQGAIVGSIPVASSLFGMTRRANGQIVVLHSGNGLLVYRLDGKLAHQLPQASTATAYGRIHHDVTATPSNSLLFIADDTLTIDGVRVTGEALWEWSPEAGTVAKRWSAFNHLDWRTERGREGNRSVVGNWLHGNGIQYGPRGNVVMSLRNISQVISIAPDFQSLEWKIGGANPTIALTDANRFFGQHYVSEPTSNRLLVFDNGFDRPGCSGDALKPDNPLCYSRAVEYSIDVASKTATQVWEYRDTPRNFAALVGSARRLSNGNTVLLFGMSSTAVEGTSLSTGPLTAAEVDQLGVVRWRLTVIRDFPTDTPSRLYRLTTYPTLLGEVVSSFR